MKKLLITSLFACLFLSNASAAVPIEKQVQSFVEKVGNDVVGIANERSSSEDEKREKIMDVIDEAIDSDWIGRFVLGKHYKTITDKQRERFLKTYRQFMTNTYGPKFKNYNGKKFTVNSVVKQSGFYVAKAEFLPRDSEVAINVDFRVKERGGRLVILDFIAEGVSLIETQRSEFNSAIAQNGIEKFLDDLDLRVKNLKIARR